MTQLTHMGHRTYNDAGDWIPAISASGTRETAHRAFSRPAETLDIARITRDFADTAARCKEAGLDGVEISVYSGHLLDEFLTPALNHRRDEYGGSFENRIRFPLEVIRAVRAAVGNDFIVGMRMRSMSSAEIGIGPEEAIRIAAAFTDEGIDFFSIIRGQVRHRRPAGEGDPADVHSRQPSPGVRGVGEEAGRRARHARLEDRRRRDRPLRDRRGTAGSRGHDPGADGRSGSASKGRGRARRSGAAVRRCEYVPGQHLHVGLDALHPQPGDRARAAVAAAGYARGIESKRCAVIGGGPAGLEAARVLAERGHAVTLYRGVRHGSAARSRWPRRSERRRDLIGIIDWRVAECRRLGVQMRRNHYVEPDEITDVDVVIVATGGVPNTSVGVPGDVVGHGHLGPPGGRRETDR